MLPIESYPFQPILPPHATVMMMGTFPPPPEKRCMAFHYPNFQNDMWRVYGLVFFNNAAHFEATSGKSFDADKIKTFLWEKGIASHPTVLRAIRLEGNAKDDELQVIESVNLPQVLAQLPQCKHIGTTGGKATEILLSKLPEKIKCPKTNQTIDYPCDNRIISLTRLPSTSRAYPLALIKKATAYAQFFQMSGIAIAEEFQAA